MEGTRIGPFLVHEKLGPYKRHNVYRATQVEQQREVALKFIKIPPKTPPAQAISRIQRETKILKKLEHPHLVKVHGAGIENGRIFFALDLIKGEPLSAILSRRSKLAWELACDYARQIACCLEYLHSQELIHLKLTPDKIMITPEGQVKVTDLRLNRTKRKRWDSIRQKAMDKAAYMAPEQFAGEKGTAKCDFYALGVILFEMLTGKLPHTADSFAALAKLKASRPAPLVSQYTLECPMWMEKIVESLLAINPNERPFSARSIIVALDEVRRADKEGIGVAEKLVSGFSPLTVGKDKSEARKALGIRKKKRKEDEVPLFQSTRFLVSTFMILLLVMTVSLAIAMRPLSNESLYERAVALSEDGKLISAQKTLLEILERGPDGNDYYDDAEILLVELRTRRLIDRAQNHPHWVKENTTGPDREFFRAFDYEQVERYDDARKAYEQLLHNVAHDDIDQRHIVNAIEERLSIVKEKQRELIQKNIREKNLANSSRDSAGESKDEKSNPDQSADREGAGDIDSSGRNRAPDKAESGRETEHKDRSKGAPTTGPFSKESSGQ